MKRLFLAAALCAAGTAGAQGAASSSSAISALSSWQFGAVLDAATTSRALALGGRDRGLQLGHSDLTAAGPLGRHFTAQLTGVLATHEGRLERELEEAWVETRTLPAGFTVRAGRFASQIGYLNAQHPHADDFVERPLLYRAFLGGHWNDDGLRLNVTLPTDTYWMVGAEAFRGRRLIAESATGNRAVGAWTLATKLGGDLGREHSWQTGLAYLRSQRIAAVEAHAEGEEAHEHEHDHGAAYGGRHTWLADATWKWAPGGNNRAQQLRVTLEAARVSGIHEFATDGQTHSAWGLGAVWRWQPSWEVGARLDRLRVNTPHLQGFEPGRLAEAAVMLAWKPVHAQTLRLQVARQGRAQGVDDLSRRTVQLQYIVSFGAHGAHSF